MEALASSARSWGGKTLAERRAARRQALTNAGLESFSAEGYVASSINRICKLAKVSERYLYEEFGGKEGLLVAVYEQLMSETLAAVQQALADADAPLEVQIRRSAEAFTRSLTDDPRRARVNFLEVVGAGPQVEARRREILRRFGQIIELQWSKLRDAGALSSAPDHSLSMALVGATQELLIDWMHSGQARPRSEIVETLVRLYLAVMQANGHRH